MEKAITKTQVYNLIILDKSGSMSLIENAAIAGFNETIGGIRAAQKQFAATQEHYVSLLTFCSCTIEYVYDCVPVNKVHKLTSRDYHPCCGTPLYDAMGMGINELFKKIRTIEGATVVVTVITDGEENSSTEYSGAAIKALVDKMRSDYGWNFAYIGTNEDVESVAIKLSINNTLFFEDSDQGMTEAWKRERKSKHRMYSRMDNAYCAAPCSSDKERLESIHTVLRENKNYQEMSEFAHRITPQKIEQLKPNQIFVFGSNPQGLHNGGAAALALKKFGARMGLPQGLQGQSYAIISTDGLNTLAAEARQFVQYAKENPDRIFLLTAVGCGSGGHTPEEVAPLFVGAVDVENIWLPLEFWSELV